MTVLWGDGFQHYGTFNTVDTAGAAETFFRQNYTANMSTGFACKIIAAPAGMSGPRSLFIQGGGFSDNSVRRIVPSSSGLYSGIRVRSDALNSNSTAHFISASQNFSGGNAFSIRVLPNGGVTIYRGNTELARNENKLVNPLQAYFSELKVDATAGVVVARINNREVLRVVGLNIPLLMFDTVGFGMAQTGSSTAADTYLGDFHIGNLSGTKNNDFIGDRVANTHYPILDASNDWALVGGPSAHEILDNVPPNAAQYIEALNDGDICRLNLNGVSSNVISIAAAIVMGRLGKSDAGAASAGIGLECDGYSDYGDEVVMGVNTAPYTRIFESLPNGITLNRDNFNASLLRVERLT